MCLLDLNLCFCDDFNMDWCLQTFYNVFECITEGKIEEKSVKACWAEAQCLWLWCPATKVSLKRTRGLAVQDCARDSSQSPKSVMKDSLGTLHMRSVLRKQLWGSVRHLGKPREPARAQAVRSKRASAHIHVGAYVQAPHCVPAHATLAGRPVPTMRRAQAREKFPWADRG